MALMGHQNRDKVHATYTHVELPVKRAAIAKLEEWVENQIQTIGGQNANKDERSSSTEQDDTNATINSNAVEEAVEEENTSANPH